MIYPRFLFIRTKYVLLSSHFYKNRQHMRITHPRLANALHESTNIQTVLEKNDEDLIEYSFKSLRIEGIKKSNLSVQSCVFSNCSFGTCCIQKSQFSDVVFKNCDLSNVNLTGCGFHRVEFIGCKLMGTNMSDGIFNHITFEECRGEYMNLSMSKMRIYKLPDPTCREPE